MNLIQIFWFTITITAMALTAFVCSYWLEPIVVITASIVAGSIVIIINFLFGMSLQKAIDNYPHCPDCGRSLMNTKTISDSKLDCEQCDCGSQFVIKRNRIYRLDSNGAILPFLRRNVSSSQWEKDESTI